MTDDLIRNMTEPEWQAAVAAAEAYGRALDTGDEDIIRAAHARALAAGCPDSDLNQTRNSRPGHADPNPIPPHAGPSP